MGPLGLRPGPGGTRGGGQPDPLASRAALLQQDLLAVAQPLLFPGPYLASNQNSKGRALEQDASHEGGGLCKGSGRKLRAAAVVVEKAAAVEGRKVLS